MQVAMTEAIKMNLSVEEADAIFGRPMGILRPEYLLYMI